MSQVNTEAAAPVATPGVAGISEVGGAGADGHRGEGL